MSRCFLRRRLALPMPLVLHVYTVDVQLRPPSGQMTPSLLHDGQHPPDIHCSLAGGLGSLPRLLARHRIFSAQMTASSPLSGSRAGRASVTTLLLVFPITLDTKLSGGWDPS